MLNQLGSIIWTVEGPQVIFAGAPMHTRMTVVKLSDGSLWLHSPVELNPVIQRAIDKLGPVRVLIA